jgi:glucose/mannose transport system substrate-binding protein
VLRAIEHYGALLDFVDPSSRARDAESTVDAVADGLAAYVVMADFAAGTFIDAGLEFGDGYTAWPTPGTEGTFDFTADAFVLPVGAVHDDAAKTWLLSVTSVEGQRVFNLRRGSIPARVDADPADFSPYQQSAMASFKVDTIVPSLAYGIAASRDWSEAITDLVVRFGIDGDPEWLHAALQSAAVDALGPEK